MQEKRKQQEKISNKEVMENLDFKGMNIDFSSNFTLSGKINSNGLGGRIIVRRISF